MFAVGIDADVGKLFVKRQALFAHGTEMGFFVRCVGERTVFVAADTFDLPRYRDVQKDDEALVGYQRAVARIKHDAAAAGHHGIVRFGEYVAEHVVLAAPEAIFAFAGEDGGDVHAGACHQCLVGIDEPPAQGVREALAERGFACPHRADHDDFAVEDHDGSVS